MTDTHIKMGECSTAQAPALFTTSGVGSCLAIILYDPVAKIGSLSHAMLPCPPASRYGDEPPDCSLRFVSCAIAEMLKDMKAKGAEQSRLIAKLVGGAHMFSLYDETGNSIGSKNVEEAKRMLTEQKIPVTSEETGGTVGRNVVFDLSTGICSVETKM